MAKIRPLRGVRYNTAMIQGDALQRVIAPPYDVIDDEAVQQLYAAHPNNVVRVDLNVIQATDSDANNRYTRARRHMLDWLAMGILKVEDEPALYVLDQRFEDAHGQPVRRRGFIGLVELEPYDAGVVLPHERTLRGPKEDRLRLMKATEANLSQIFMLYNDPAHAVDQALADGVAAAGEPALVIDTPDGINHTLWAVRDPDIHARVEAALAAEALLIADGHHRYETALAYQAFRREVDEAPIAEAPADFVLTFLVNVHDPGLIVWPTHRVLHSVEGLDPDAVIAALSDSPEFHVEALDISPDDGAALLARCGEAGEAHPSFIALSKGLAQAHLVQFIGAADSASFHDDTPQTVRALDVAVLHEIILDRMLGVDREAQAAKTNLRYMKQLDEALEEVSRDDVQLVFLMNPTPVEQVDRVCRSGGLMPQKSTYFYPKVPSGLVINLL